MCRKLEYPQKAEVFLHEESLAENRDNYKEGNLEKEDLNFA
jgi:hypothetical protein